MIRAVAVVALAVGVAACRPPVDEGLDAALPDAATPVEVQDPVRVLEDAAANLDPTPRGRALDLLILAATEPAGGAYGPRALYDPDPWVQRKAVEALAMRLNEPETQALLRKYVGRSDIDPYVRQSAAMHLARHGGAATDGLRDVMSAAWRAESQAWRQAPLALAAASLGDRDAIAPLAAAISRADIGLEVEFVLDLGRSGLEELVPPLREGAAWVEDEMALPYACAQILLGDPSGESVLRKALASDDEEIRLEAIDYLARMDGAVARSLLERAAADPSDLVRAYAEGALAARGERSLDKLERLMESPDREMRLIAVRFASEAAQPVGGGGRRAGRVAKRIVRTGLVDGDVEVRMNAFGAIGQLDLEGEDASLTAGLADEYLAVRVEAAGAKLLVARR